MVGIIHKPWLTIMVRSFQGYVCENVTIWISYHFPQIFPMHAEDDCDLKLFLITKNEVEILCESPWLVCGPFTYPLFTQSFSS